MQDEYSKAEPAQYIIDILKDINEIPNIDLYILSLQLFLGSRLLAELLAF